MKNSKMLMIENNRINRPRSFELADIKKDSLSAIFYHLNDDEKMQLKAIEEYVEFQLYLNYKILSKRSIYHSLARNRSVRQSWLDQLQNVVESIDSGIMYDPTELFAVEHAAYRLLFEIDQKSKVVYLQSLAYRGDIYLKQDSWVPL